MTKKKAHTSLLHSYEVLKLMRLYFLLYPLHIVKKLGSIFTNLIVNFTIFAIDALTNYGKLDNE